mgnify:CR=1 FL=1
MKINQKLSNKRLEIYKNKTFKFLLNIKEIKVK